MGSEMCIRDRLAGTGTLLRLLAAGGVPTLPVGFAEEGGRLRCRVGHPFHPGRGGGTEAAEEAMRRIAALLPERMRGRFAPWEER